MNTGLETAAFSWALQVATASTLALYGTVLLVLVLLRAQKAVAGWLHERRRGQVLAHLRDALLDPDSLPLAALEAAGEVGFAPVIRVLYETRERLSGATSEGAGRALRVLGAQSRLLAMARSRWQRRRLNGLELLGICGGSAALPVLREVLEHPDAMTRRFARRALARVAQEDGLRAALRSFVEDEPNPYGWRAAFYSQVGLRAPEVLLRWSQDTELSERHCKLVLEALSAVGYDDVTGLALAAVEADDAELRASAVRTLGLTASHDGLAAVLEGLVDPVWFVRAAAARALAGFPHQVAVRRGALAAALDDENWWVRANAAESLCRLSLVTPEAQEDVHSELPPELQQVLGRASVSGRKALAAALGRQSDEMGLVQWPPAGATAAVADQLTN